MNRMWIYSKSDPPQVIERADFENYQAQGWEDSPAHFFDCESHGIDPDDFEAVQIVGRALEQGAKWMNLALNIDTTRKKDLIAYAKEAHAVTIPKRFRVAQVRLKVQKLVDSMEAA